MNKQNLILDNKKKLVVPEIKLKCPNCDVEFSAEAMHRIYRAYLTLTRFSRAECYNAICCICGKHTKLRVPPLHLELYKCKKCLFRAEHEGKIGYKRNPLANQRME